MQQREQNTKESVSRCVTTEKVVKRVIDRTETSDNFLDGTFSTIKREHIEETLPPASSGLLEAWFGLVLLLSTGVVFGLIFKLLGFGTAPTPQLIRPTYIIQQTSQTLAPEQAMPEEEFQRVVNRFRCHQRCTTSRRNRMHIYKIMSTSE